MDKVVLEVRAGIFIPTIYAYSHFGDFSIAYNTVVL